MERLARRRPGKPQPRIRGENVNLHCRPLPFLEKTARCASSGAMDARPAARTRRRRPRRARAPCPAGGGDNRRAADGGGDHGDSGVSRGPQRRGGPRGGAGTAAVAVAAQEGGVVFHGRMRVVGTATCVAPTYQCALTGVLSRVPRPQGDGGQGVRMVCSTRFRSSRWLSGSGRSGRG